MEKKTGIILVLLTAVISGVSIFLNGFAVKGFDSSVFTFAKNAVVATLLFALVLGLGQLRQLKALSRKQWLQLSALGLIGGSIPFLLFFRGLQMTTGATSSFIHKTMFVFIAVFAILFLKEKLTKGLAIGAALLLAGNYLVLRPSFTLSAGHILVFAAMLLWAVESVFAKAVVKNMSGTVVAFGRMFFGSVFILAFLAATGKAHIISAMSAAQYGWIAVTAALLFGYVITFYNGLKTIKVSTAACILTLGSPITTALTMFKGGGISPFEIAGAVFIMAGVAAVLALSRDVGNASWTASA